MDVTILRPAMVLVVWTLAMLGWVLATRLPALRAAGVDLGKLVGSRPADADRALPPRTQWKAHNYNHLLEQPTLFYATCGVLAIAGAAHAADVLLAWSYVGLRIAHSLWQATVNRVSIRLGLFIASSAVLLLLALRSLVALF